MKIKVTKELRKVYNNWEGDGYESREYPFYKVYAVDKNGKEIFGTSATVNYEKENKEYMPHFGSCHDTMAFMEIRLAVIKKAYSIARKLNKK